MASEEDPLISKDEDRMGSAHSVTTKELVVLTENMKMAVASLSLLGVGCSGGYYLAPAGFFEHKFESSTFFLRMLCAISLPYPVMLLLQEKYDQHFDSAFGPRQTYFFRIIAVQIMLAAIFAGYSFSSESPSMIILCGVLIGSFSAAAWSSTMQLISAWDPPLAAWASVGKDVAGSMPVVTYFMLEFSASRSSAGEFERMQLFPIAVVCICILCLTGLHTAGIWDKAYSRLGYDLWEADANSTTNRQLTETDPLLAKDEVDETGQPLWTPKWQLAAGLNVIVSFIPLPLIPCMGDADLTQKLTLSKLAMDCVSRLIAAFSAKTDLIGMEAPRHFMLIGQLLLRTALSAMLVGHILSFAKMSSNIFFAIWLLSYVDGGFVDSQIDVTLARFAPVALRKSIARRKSLLQYTGLALSLVVVVIILLARKDISI